MTEQQAKMLREIRAGQKTTRELAAALGLSLDAARNCATRMESRSWISGMGTGADRKWTVTATGNAAWGELGSALVGPEDPPAAAGSPNGATSGSQSQARQQVIDEQTGKTRDETESEQRKREAATEKDSSPTRTYVVLEEIDLPAAIELTLANREVEFDEGFLDPVLDALEGAPVYLQVATPIARNTEHAFRQTAKDVYGGGDVDEPVLVAVAAKMFQPTPVNVNNTQTVSIGRPRALAA